MKWRLFLAFSGLITMVLLAQDVPLASYLRRVESERLFADLQRDAFILAGTSEDQLAHRNEAGGDAADLAETLRVYGQRDGARALLFDTMGAVVASSDGTPAGETFANRPEVAEALRGIPTSGERDSATAGSGLLFTAVPVLSGADVVGAVRITLPDSEVSRRAWKRQRGLLVVFGMSIASALLAARFVAGGLTAPLRRLQRSTERLASGDTAVRADTERGPKEIRSLARSFNTMTAQISGLIDREKAFVGDASHQLRTPLTALRLQLDTARSIAEQDPAAALERIDAASDEVERLQRLVQGLLLLAKGDVNATASTTVDLSMIAAERVGIWAPLCEERGVALHADVVSHLLVSAAAGTVEQVLDNYIDNALAVTSTGGSIVVRVWPRASAGSTPATVSASVIDEGPGMMPEHLARAFDRFWRAPDAAHDGSGLGLAIVQRLAVASQATVAVSNRPDRPGLIAEVTFIRA